MANSYDVDFSSTDLTTGISTIPGKNRITLTQQTADSSSTSVILTGKGLNNYGEIQQENFLKLMENFANATAPAHPTIGQIWFDTAENKLKMFDMTQAWVPIGSIQVQTATPASTVGTLWYNTDEHILYLKVESTYVRDEPRYHGDWVQVWPSITRHASIFEFNAFAQRINRILGSPQVYGGQQYGWNQTNLLPYFTTLNAPAAFDNTYWELMQDTVRKMALHVGVNPSLIQPYGFISDGRGAVPLPPTFGTVTMMAYWAWMSEAITLIEQNRAHSFYGTNGITDTIFGTYSGDTDLIQEVGIQYTRTANWSSDKTYEVLVTFPSVSMAKAFFNAGGNLVIYPSHTPSISNAGNIGWQQFLEHIGFVQLLHDKTNWKNGVYNSIGYYSLTASAVTILAENNPNSGVYINESGFNVSARIESGGAQVRFFVNFVENSGVGEIYNATPVQGSTKVTVQSQRPGTANLVHPVFTAPTMSHSGTFITG